MQCNTHYARLYHLTRTPHQTLSRFSGGELKPVCIHERYLLPGCKLQHRSSYVFSLIEREKISHLELVPTLLIRLLNESLLKEYNLSPVRIVNTGGQKLQPEVKRSTEELIPFHSDAQSSDHSTSSILSQYLRRIRHHCF